MHKPPDSRATAAAADSRRLMHVSVPREADVHCVPTRVKRIPESVLKELRSRSVTTLGAHRNDHEEMQMPPGWAAADAGAEADDYADEEVEVLDEFSFEEVLSAPPASGERVPVHSTMRPTAHRVSSALTPVSFRPVSDLTPPAMMA